MDYESFCKAPLGGKTGIGAQRYARDPSAEILMIGLGVGDERVVVWVNPAICENPNPQEQMEGHAILANLASKRYVIFAHNAPFELAISEALFTKTTGFPCPQQEQFRCTQAMTRRAGLPPALDEVANMLGLPAQKDKAGTALIQKFCVPQKNKCKPTENAKTLAKRALNPHRDRIMPTDSAQDMEDFKAMIEYCRQDVVVERQVAHALKYFALTGDALATFQLDLTINKRGFPVNLTAIEHAVNIIEETESKTGDEFRALTGLKHTQREKILLWLQTRGWAGKNLKADTVDAYLDGLEESDDEDEDSQETEYGEDDGTDISRALMLRKRLTYAATKKVKAIKAMVGPDDNRVRGTLILWGAGPGRWAGFKVQPQNMKRPSTRLVKKMPWKDLGFKNEGKALSWVTHSAYRDILAGCSADFIEIMYGPPLEVVSSCIRHFIHDYHSECCNCSGSGIVEGESSGMWGDRFQEACPDCDGTGIHENEMLSADFSAIEARGVCWLAGQEDALEEYRQGIDRYIRMASKIYGVPYEDVTEFPQRFVGKQAVLLLGYQGGGAKFRMTCEKYNYFDLPEGMEDEVVKAYREMHPEIVKLWRKMEASARSAILDPGKEFHVNDKLSFRVMNIKAGWSSRGTDFLLLKLPSGREISYPFPELTKCLSYTYEGKRVQIMLPEAHDIEKATRRVGERKFFLKDVITYLGKTGKDGTRAWGRVQTYGAKLVENCISGDCEVLTPTGWKLLEDVKDTDLVWDGIEFVPHAGLVCQGYQRVVNVCGVWATSDHQFLTTSNVWVAAEAACIKDPMELNWLHDSKHTQEIEFSGADFWQHESNGVCQVGWQEISLACALFLWKKVCQSWSSTIQNATWMLPQMPNYTKSYGCKNVNSWYVEAPSIWGVALNEPTLPGQKSSGISQLWRQGHISLQTLAAQLYQFLERHGANMAGRVGFRSQEQQRKLHTKKLPLDHKADKQPKHKVFCHPQFGVGYGEKTWGENVNSVLEDCQGGETRDCLHKSSESVMQVFDIRDCGPRNRFMIRTTTGALLISHNCTQGLAADFMVNGAINSERHGYEIATLIHDESLNYKQIGQTSDELCRFLTELPPWADGMPLASEGKIVPFYAK